MKGVNGQKDWANFPVDKKWAIYNKLVGMSGWKVVSYLKPYYTISGCRFYYREVSYVQVLL